MILRAVRQLTLIAHLLLLLCAGTAVMAQQDDRVVMPWSPLGGVYEIGPNGERTSFFMDLATGIAEVAKLELEFREYPTLQDVFAAQASGETDMLPGVGRLPVLASTNVFSEPLAESAIYLFVRQEDPQDLDPETMEGRTIGVISSTLGSDQGSLGGRNDVIEFPDPERAFMALLLGRIDGVVTVHRVASNFLGRAKLDYRVRTAGAPLQFVDHVVALHESRADLLPKINAALRVLAVRGDLEEMLVRWNMVAPEPVPDVLSVGVAHFPPYQVITPDGDFTGFGVEALRGLAQRAGLDIQMKEITLEEWGLGPGPGGYDILPPISVDDARRARMDFTRPIQRSPYAIFLRAGEAQGITGLDDLTGLAVGITENNVARGLIEGHEEFSVAVFDGPDALLRGLRDGTVDAIVYPRVTVRRLAEERGFANEIEDVPEPFMYTERAIALRFGLGAVRERLNVVIPGYLSSEEFAELRNRWLEPPDFWTAERRRQVAIGAAGIFALVTLAFLFQNIRARRRAEALTAETRDISNRLSAILNAAQSGVLGLRADGLISVVNPGARRLLALPDDNPPFAWPSGIDFVNAETMSPLEKSSHPLHRALAGAILRGETALMYREGADAPRYVRVSSTPVEESTDADVTTVVVIEDVTEQERNRQQVERTVRLDALGQLTGGIAHDFNNLLATIEYAIVLSSGGTDEPENKYLAAALASVKRGSELTSRLLAFAKKQPGKQTSARASRVIDDFRKLAAPTIENSIDLQFVNDEDDPLVYCDIHQLENALLNLVLNSRDAIIGSGVGDRITVKVRGLISHQLADQAGREGAGKNGAHFGHFVEFSVTDNSSGMTDEVKRRAIDPFFSTKSKTSGTGLGLSMVFGFVEQASGEMRIYSELGQGTTVRLILPRGTEGGAREAPLEAMAPEKGEGQRILVVEDEDALLTAIAGVLESLNYEVLPARSGREALDLVMAGETFDLLLTDVVMPGGIGGFQLAKEVRSRRPGLPVVYMSGYASITEREMGEVIAPTLQKPCPPAELAAALRRELKAGAPG